ncbi:MAG: cell wall-binding repeat-containing protein [Actinomycetaceae bacterium]|nr:cell wall-binding repeat-containing protein [Actinomycetaceae bacterium]
MRRIRIWTAALAALAVVGVATPVAAAPSELAPPTETPVTSSSVNLVPTSSVKGLSARQVADSIQDISASQNSQSQYVDTAGRLVTRTPVLSARVLANDSYEYAAATMAIKPKTAIVVLTWDRGSEEPLAVLGRERKGSTWGEWEALNEEVVFSKSETRQGSEPWLVRDADEVQAVVVSADGVAVGKPTLEVIDPGIQLTDALAKDPKTLKPVELGRTFSGPLPGTADGPGGNGEPEVTTPQPDADATWTVVPSSPDVLPIRSRADWGADPSWMKWDLSPAEVRGAVVHHTAGANGYAPEDVPGIIRAIYRYHAVTLGWGDIGYNVLVDNFGRAWQGRAGSLSSPIPGGHALNVNKQTFGISVLGSYGTVAPSAAAQDAVARVLAWKLDSVAGVDPGGRMTLTVDGQDSSVPTIIGHRDVPGRGGKTSCPGNAFYAELDGLRQLTRIHAASKKTLVTVPVYVAPPPVSVPTSNKIPMRIAGNDRIATAVSIAYSGFPSGASTIYLARSDVYADALAAGSVTDGPILLVSPTDPIPASVKKVVTDFKASRVVALGGPSALGDALVTEIAQGLPTSRLFGADRVETSAAIARASWSANVGKMGVVYLAEASQGIDAVAAGSLTDGPVVLVPKGTQAPASVKALISELNPTFVLALGGPMAVSDAVLSDAAQGRITSRVAGADRVATAVAISGHAFPNGSDKAYIANANNPVDAIAGGTLSDGPILLQPQGSELSKWVANEVTRLNPRGATALGGSKAVHDKALNAAVDLVKR